MEGYKTHYIDKKPWDYNTDLNPEIKAFGKDGKIDLEEAEALKEILYFNNVKKHREIEVLKKTTKESLEFLRELSGMTKYLKFEINKILKYSEYKTINNLKGLEKLIENKKLRYEDIQKWKIKKYKSIRLWIDGKPDIVSISELDRFFLNFKKSKSLRKVVREEVDYKVEDKKIENAINTKKFPKKVGSYINQKGEKKNILLKKSIHPGFGNIPDKIEYIVELDDSTGWFQNDLKIKFNKYPNSFEIKSAIRKLLSSNKKLQEKTHIRDKIEIKKRAIKDILDYIALAEGTKQKYNVRFGHRKVPNLSNMTLNQVINYQDKLISNYIFKKKHGLISKKHYESSAIGRYQFMLETLTDFKRSKNITGNEKFTPEFQDKLAIKILKQLGLNKFLSGKISLNQFLHKISMRWASVPDPYNQGKSFHHKDGINKVTYGAKKGYKEFMRKMKKYQILLK